MGNEYPGILKLSGIEPVSHRKNKSGFFVSRWTATSSSLLCKPLMLVNAMLKKGSVLFFFDLGLNVLFFVEFFMIRYVERDMGWGQEGSGVGKEEMRSACQSVNPSWRAQ